MSELSSQYAIVPKALVDAGRLVGVLWVVNDGWFVTLPLLFSISYFENMW